jgi:hypothetical protein
MGSAACGIGGVAALAEGFVEDNRSGGGDVEGAYAAGHGDAEQVVAGFADEVVEACAFAAEDEDAVAAEIELVVVGCAAFVESNDPHILALELFKGADEVDDSGDAEMLGCAGAGLHGDRAERSGTTLGEDDAVYACAVGYTEKSAEVLGVFNAVEGEQQAARADFLMVWGEKVFDGQRLLRAHHGHYALMGRSLGQERQLLAGILTNANTGLAESGDEMFETQIFALAGDYHLVKATPAGL